MGDQDVTAAGTTLANPRPRRARRQPLAVLGLVVAATLVASGCGDAKPAAEPRQEARPQPTPQQGESRPDGVVSLRSRPDLRPPMIAVDEAPDVAGDRLMFVSPRLRDAERDGAARQQGALGLDERGRTVWFAPTPDLEPVTEVRVQEYRGKPVLTWWQGTAGKGGIGDGVGVIVDRGYRRIATVRAAGDRKADLHEFLLTPRGTALLTIYHRTTGDLTAFGRRPDARVIQGIVQEVDVETGELLFEWESMDHVPPSESIGELPKTADQPFDYFHINSVDEDAHGDLLVSARHTSAVYKIDRETGKVLWRLGGKRNDFDMGPGAAFGLQHDARFLGDGVIQIFDNADEAKEGAEQAPSSVKRLDLDVRRKRARLVERWRQPDDMWAQTQGNAQALPGGGVMAGWGSTGAFSRFAADGRLIFDAHLPAQYDSYRAHFAAWNGRPATPPAVHARRDEELVTVAASWNGSTEVRRWQVLAGPNADDLRPVGATAQWSGLETTIIRSTDEPYVAVEAVDGAGRTLERSAAVRPAKPARGR